MAWLSGGPPILIDMDQRTKEAGRRLLANYYSRQSGSVAFIDESIRGAERPDEFPFYILSAVVLSVRSLDEVRASYQTEVGGDFWHTTDSYRNGEYSNIQRLSAVVAGSMLESAISLQIDMDSMTVERARKESFIQLATFLFRQGCSLCVYEQRNTLGKNASDVGLIKLAQASELVPKGITLVGSKPAIEPLLWGPDLVSWCFRQILTRGQSGWFKPFSEQSSVIDVSGFYSKNAKRPETAAARNSGPVSPAALFEGKAIRSSTKSMPEANYILQEISHMSSNFVRPPLSPSEIRMWLETNHPTRPG